VMRAAMFEGFFVGFGNAAQHEHRHRRHQRARARRASAC
jgi:hypothetical protein